MASSHKFRSMLKSIVVVASSLTRELPKFFYGRYIHTPSIQRYNNYVRNVFVAFTGTTPFILSYSTVYAQATKENDGLSRREQRFNEFASCEFDGQVVMTPHDFIQSLIENQPQIPRNARRLLTKPEIIAMNERTPDISKGSNLFFRGLDQNGVITYSEYLFMVTVLTKSNVGLKTALRMMDVNGDKNITQEEFQLIEKMINKSSSQQQTQSFSTTLLVHLFGKDGKHVVSFESFFKFMDDFQSEVLELEFHEYAKSVQRICEVDFAKILLRNTMLSGQEYSQYLNRLKTRIHDPKGVSLEQFKSFHFFLSNIDDFIIAVRMINVMNQPVNKDLFTRAIKVSTGQVIDPYIVDVVFKLFDQDGDGKLSQEEFIGIMKDRLKRGFGKFPNIRGIDGFKSCLKKEMARPSE